MTKNNWQLLCVLFVGLIAVAGMWQFAGAQGEKVAIGVKWEYTTVNAGESGFAKINVLGREGWELVAIEPAHGTSPAVLYLKRGK